MSNPTCSAASLVESFPCLSNAVLNSRQRQAIGIWFKVKALAAIGGTSYVSVLDSTLISDAVALADTMNLAQRDLAHLAILRNNAVASGANLSSDTSTLLDSVKCLINYQDLDAIDILLDCKLGAWKAYPQ